MVKKVKVKKEGLKLERERERRERKEGRENWRRTLNEAERGKG